MKYCVVSDIHLGHKNTPTVHIVKNLIRFICTDDNQDLDVIFIAGDVFDRLLDLNAESVHGCLHFFNTIIRYCFNNQIKLRVLEGTPSHDWQQCKTLVRINELKNNKCDLKYFTVLDIEYMEDLKLHVLYIPDEWVNDHVVLEKEIAAKLQEHNLTKVDVAILHGQFEYQVLGKPYKGFFFQEQYFLNIVKGYIHVGHYHTHSYYDRIVAQGSFDRLVHGEEGDKGYVKVVVGTKPSYQFIVNTNAYIYKTIRVTSRTTLDSLDRVIHKLPRHSHVRLSVDPSSEFNMGFDELKVRYPDYYLKKLIKSEDIEKTVTSHVLDSTEIDFHALGYSNGNILESLYGILKDKHHLNENQMLKAKAYLEPYRATLV
jgi:DNA repair exonuclease SbcCD nuclease subunit